MKLSKRVFLTVLLCILGSGCSFADESYFPSKNLDEYPQISDLLEDWYSKQLRALGEGPLWQQGDISEAYRFTWLRTFHKPLSFRLVVLADGTGVLYTKGADGAGGFDPGKIVLNEERKVDLQTVRAIQGKIDQIQFWALPTYERGSMGLDGAQWIFEGRRHGAYHIVDRSSPPSGAYRETMLELMRLSGVEVGEIY